MQIAPQDYKTSIAAEVAARYGVTVKPEAVQIIPRGISGTPPYVWDGRKGLVQMTPQEPGHAIRAQMTAAWRERQRKIRLSKAAKVKQPKTEAQLNREHFGRMQAVAAERAEGIRNRAANGATLDDIAAHMGITRNSAAKYCARYNIKPTPRDVRSPLVAQRLAKVRAFMADGSKTVADVATLLKTSWKNAQGYCRRHNLEPVRTERVVTGGLKAAAKARHEDALDAVRQRREKVRALFCAGIGQSEIARQIGANAQMVGKDVKVMGLSRADYPIAKPVSEKPTHKPEAIERRRLVGEMRAEGRKIAEIAHALGCSFAAVQRDMTVLGITTRTNSASHVGNPAMVRQVKAMRARKMSIREIAEALKIAKSTVVRMYQVGEAA